MPAGLGVARIPAGVTTGDAGALGVAGATALVSLDAVALAEGETVLISGASGGVGALAVQLAVARGATVIATARPGAQTDFVTGLTDAVVHVVDFTSGLQTQVVGLRGTQVVAAMQSAQQSWPPRGLASCVSDASGVDVISPGVVCTPDR
ncbi:MULTISPECIES: hypothetical protein [unclassified Streptomyces]|uniref:hypothetical protein n=1 Tax=unclassified Streptomyces TaxID=2593676 RepID=UPI0036EF1837